MFGEVLINETILQTLLAYFSALRVSSKSLEAGLMQQIIRVLELPPSESFSRRVIFESLYGM